MNLFRATLFVALLATMAMFPRSASAQTQIFDWGPNGSGTPTGGTGNWNTTSSNWVIPGSLTYQIWPNAMSDIADFAGTAGTVTITGTITAGGLTFDSDGYILNAASSKSLILTQVTNQPAVITVTNSGQTATISAPFSDNDGLNVTGSGTLILTGTSTSSSSNDNFNIYGGATVKVMSATGALSPNNSLLSGVQASVVNNSSGAGGGTFIYDNTGATGASTQSLVKYVADGGDNIVETNRVANQNVALSFSFGELARVEGATVNFIINGGTNGTTNEIVLSGQTTGFIDQGNFFGGSNYAWYDAGGFVRGIVYSGSSKDANTLTTSGTTSIVGTTNLYIQTTGAVTAQNTATFTTLNLAGTGTTAGSNDFTLASGKTLTVNGILRSGNVSGSSSTISGGTGIEAGRGLDLVIRTDQVNDSLTISSAILDDHTSSLTKSGSGTLTLSGNNTYAGETFINGGTLIISSLPNLSTTGSPTTGPLGAPTSAPIGSVVLQGGTLEYTGATASTTRGFDVANGGGGIDVTNSGTALTFTGEGLGNGTNLAIDTLVKTGSGTLILSGTNDDVSLGVTVNAGTLQLAKTSSSNAHSLGATLALVVNNGGTVQITGTGNDQITDGSDVIVNTGGTFDFNGKNETWDGLSGGGSVTNNAASTASTLTLGGGNNASGNSRDVFSGAISNGIHGAKIALTKIGTGTQTLSGSNTYTGATTVSAGILNIQSNNALGTGSGTSTSGVSVASGAALQIQGTISTTTAVGLTLNGTGVNSSGALENVSGTNTYSGLITLGAATTIGSDIGTLNITNTGTITGSGLALTLTGTGNGSITSNIGTGSGGLTKTGSGTWSLSGANTFIGVTAINGGTLSVSQMANGGSAGGIGKSTNVAANLVLNGGDLQYTGAAASTDHAFTLGSNGGTLDASGTGAINFASTGSVAFSGNGTRTLTLTGNNTGANTLAAVLGNGTGGATSITKNGVGAWTLTGTSTYTGATTVSQGTLTVSGTGSINGTSGTSIATGGAFNYSSSTALTAAVTLNGGTFAYNNNSISYNASKLTFNSGTLKGTGTISGNLGLHSAAQILSPGNSPGIQVFSGTQNWSAFTYQWETNNFTGTTAGTDFDQIQVTGALNLSDPSGNYLLNVTSLTSGDVAGNVPNFSNTDESWTILTASSGITNFDPNEWTINTSAFTSTPTATGTWSLAVTGPGNDNLVLSYDVSSVPEPTTYALLLAGMALLMLVQRRYKHLH